MTIAAFLYEKATGRIIQKIVADADAVAEMETDTVGLASMVDGASDDTHEVDLNTGLLRKKTG